MHKGYTLPTRNLVSQANNSLVERAHVPRSRFINRYGLKTAFDAGKLYPILLEEILPGDHVRYKVSGYVRTAEPVFPLLDSQRIDIHFFYCPTRVLWANWPKMLGAQDNPGDSTNFTIPIVDGATIPANGPAVGSLLDYLGVPTQGQIAAGQGPNLILNALPARMYNRIWNSFYRDENLQTSSSNGLTSGDGPDSYASMFIRPRNKSHDYFTAQLTAPQKGTAPNIPLAGNALVYGLGVQSPGLSVGPFAVTDANAGAVNYNLAYRTTVDEFFIRQDVGNTVYADLTTASGFSINTFRLAMGMQTVLERDARGGTRYIEQMKMHWGVEVPDYRLQRPEYMNGGSMAVAFTPVANTNADGTDALGTLGAAGTADGVITADYAAVEHGYIMALASVKTELSYQQGLHRLWSRRTRWDFPIPGLMELGEQATLRREIYCTGAAANDEAVFGYNPRWEEYRTEVSKVTGLMRSTAAGNIDEWHFAQQFTAAPTLSDTFIQDTPPMTRVLAAGAAAAGIQYKADFIYDRTIVRPLPTYGTPSTLGRF